ncbi:ABC transporter ATP-binding protein [Jeotgalibaca arthritidis]|uniref:ABC transporter ATP-binding protein n=1 Tax=Jeotgalibaca arthritidis TaxID=1868794 RepID=A0A6G7KCK1_9LACT|nr:ABC transporter ATP-binding protein [Jeotgalibaca arthritidis]QII82952.1 ABC transporter ATP-binding protein [Jeotgalibaca arthritidis]
MEQSVWSKTIPVKEQVRVVKRIVAYALPFKAPFIWSFIFGVGLAITDVVSPRIIQVFLDNYVTQGEATISIAIQFSLLYMLSIIISMLTMYFQNYLFSVASEKTVENIRNQLFRKVNQLGMRYFDQTPAGSIVSRVTNDTETIKDFWAVFLALAEGLLSIVTVFIAMWVLDVKITLTFLYFLPVMALMVWFYQRVSTRVYRTMREKLSELNTKLNENILGMSIIQQFRQEKRLQKEFSDVNEEYARGRIAMVRMNALLLNPFISLLQAIALTVVLYLFGEQSFDQFVEIGVIYSFTSYINNFFRPLGMMMDNLSVFQDGIVSSYRVIRVLDHDELVPQQNEEADLAITKGKIEFKNVTFAYDNEHNVLKNISFTANPGETVALIGHTGSGKSSIINVLMRFYEFYEGDILIDGQSIKKYPIEEIRRQMGLVLQDSFLFYGDVSRNIRLMNDELDDVAIQDAAEFVHANHFIEQFPEQYHAKVIERGASYSSGERQLISFARTIIRDPKILVLDEATANIDTETELLIQESMNKMRKGRTTIAIAHRLSTIRDADLILVLDKGEIIERGKHDDLIAKKGIYYDMYQLQSMSD